MITFRNVSIDAAVPGIKIEDIRVSPIQLSPTTRVRPINPGSDFVRMVQACIESDKEGGCYNLGNGWQVTLEEQIKGIIEVFSPKDNPSEVIYVPNKPDPLENAFDMSKTFGDFPSYRPKYSYLDQLRDFKHEMETEPMAQLWGRKEDYEE